MSQDFRLCVSYSNRMDWIFRPRRTTSQEAGALYSRPVKKRIRSRKREMKVAFGTQNVPNFSRGVLTVTTPWTIWEFTGAKLYGESLGKRIEWREFDSRKAVMRRLEYLATAIILSRSATLILDSVFVPKLFITCSIREALSGKVGGHD